MHKRKYEEEKSALPQTDQQPAFIYPDWRFAIVCVPEKLGDRPQFLHYFAYRKEEDAANVFNLVTPDSQTIKTKGFKNDRFYNQIFAEVYSDADIQKIFKLMEAQSPINQDFLKKIFRYESMAFVLIFECQRKKIYKQKIVIYK